MHKWVVSLGSVCSGGKRVLVSRLVMSIVLRQCLVSRHYFCRIGLDLVRDCLGVLPRQGIFQGTYI